MYTIYLLWNLYSSFCFLVSSPSNHGYGGPVHTFNCIYIYVFVYILNCIHVLFCCPVHGQLHYYSFWYFPLGNWMFQSSNGVLGYISIGLLIAMLYLLFVYLEKAVMQFFLSLLCTSFVWSFFSQTIIKWNNMKS